MGTDSAVIAKTRGKRKPPQEHVRKSYVEIHPELQLAFLACTASQINCFLWAARYATPDNGWIATASHKHVGKECGLSVDTVDEAFKALEAKRMVRRIPGTGERRILSVYEVLAVRSSWKRIGGKNTPHIGGKNTLYVGVKNTPHIGGKNTPPTSLKETILKEPY